MSVAIIKTSRLNFYDLLSEDGYEFWQNRVLPVPSMTKDDQKKQINGEDRIDNVAYNSYEDPVLWWVIAIFNGMKITTDWKMGDTIRIPSQRNLFVEIFK